MWRWCCSIHTGSWLCHCRGDVVECCGMSLMSWCVVILALFVDLLPAVSQGFLENGHPRATGWCCCGYILAPTFSMILRILATLKPNDFLHASQDFTFKELASLEAWGQSLSLCGRGCPARLFTGLYICTSSVKAIVWKPRRAIIHATELPQFAGLPFLASITPSLILPSTLSEKRLGMRSMLHIHWRV